MKKIWLVAIVVSCWTTTNYAQCAMCKASAETNAQNGGKAAAGLNSGILYLLTIPYVLIGTMGFMWWRNRQQLEDAEHEETIGRLLEHLD